MTAPNYFCESCGHEGHMNLIIEKWEKPLLGILGTIRTVPENYYVCGITQHGLYFSGIESKTRNIDKEEVQKWYNDMQEHEKIDSLQRSYFDIVDMGRD